MRMNNNNGFTLIELMVTLSVVAVLLSAGVPAFGTMIKNNRMTTKTYELRAVLSAARSEAQTQRTTVTVCRSANGTDCSTGDWSEGYIAFIDLNDNEKLDGDEQLLQEHVKNNQGISLSYSQAGDILRFDGNGNAVGSSGTFSFCDDRSVQDARHARGLIVSPIGSVRAAASETGDSSLPALDHEGNKLCDSEPSA